MLGRETELFQSIKSIEYVCYRESEVTDDELRRLLRELPGAGVTLIELDEWETGEPDMQEVCVSDMQKACEPDQQKKYAADVPEVCIEKKGRNGMVGGACTEVSPCPATTLLLAGSARTLSLAKGTPMATIGYGQLAAAGGETHIDNVEGVDKRTHEEKMCGKVSDTDEADGNKRASGTASGNTVEDLQPDILVEGFDEVDVQFLDRIMKRAQGLPWITVVTMRCYLREITLDDMDDLFALYSQPGITDYTDPLYERPEEEQYTKDYIEKMYRFYGYGMWLVCDRTNGALIGRAGFSHQDLGDEIVLEMGYIIGVPYQRQGYATEVCEKLIAFARTNLSDFGTLNCFVEPGNTASHGLMEKLEFEKIGTVMINDKMMVRYEKSLTK